MAPALTFEIIQQDVVDRLLDLADDPIPNIKFNVAKSLEVLATTYGTTAQGKQLIQTRILPKLEIQKNDADADVRYFATRAIQNTQNTLAASGSWDIRMLLDKETKGPLSSLTVVTSMGDFCHSSSVASVIGSNE